MNSVDSVVDFFYNVVPGIIFLIVLDSVYELPWQFGAEKIFPFIVLGLFLGFTSQVIVKFLRATYCFNNIWIFPEVIKDEVRFKRVDRLLRELDLIDDKEEVGNNSLEKKFHIMDNYLRGKLQSEIINHFASKAAFWSNIFIASLTLMIIGSSKMLPSKLDEIKIDENILIYIPMAFLIMSLLAATHYWRIQYDVIMKTFLAVYNIDVKSRKLQSFWRRIGKLVVDSSM